MLRNPIHAAVISFAATALITIPAVAVHAQGCASGRFAAQGYGYRVAYAPAYASPVQQPAIAPPGYTYALQASDGRWYENKDLAVLRGAIARINEGIKANVQPPVEPPAPTPQVPSKTPPVIAPPVATPVTPPVVQQPATDGYGFTSWLNATRAANGRSPVAYDPLLSSECAAHNATMRAHGFKHHNLGHSRRHNVAMGGTGAWERWMQSAGHREALLDPTITMIGIAFDGAYWTFGAR